MKKRNVFIGLFVVVFLLFSVFALGCAKKTDEPKEPEAQFPEIVVAPTASDLVLGEAIGSAELKGEFSVAGELRFSEPDFVPQSIGKLMCGWIFTPEDRVNYRTLTGKAEIEVFMYVLTFEENGGFDISDIYFNDSYTLEHKPITCKNDYRFDGWSLGESSEALIEYPYVFTHSQTLCAKYMTCTLDKLAFIDGFIAELSWRKYWLDRGEPEKAARNLPSDLRYTDDIPEDAIGGEIIIPDMHDDVFLIWTRNFSHSNITSITFNNVMVKMDSFKKTRLRSVTVPNTVAGFATEQFRGCAELKELIYEGGESAVEAVYDENVSWLGAFELKFEYKLRIRNTYTGLLLVGVPSLERLEYRNITAIGPNLWVPIKSITIPNTVEALDCEAFYGCDKLEEVIFEDGINLMRVDNRAFGECRALKKIKIPASARIHANAFEGCVNLEEIDITDEQITDMARHLHSAYIDGYYPYVWDEENKKLLNNPEGFNRDFQVDITRGAQYARENAQGEYVHGEEKIKLYIDKFDIYAIMVLCHEFFHHYQQVLCYGVGDENWATVPYCNVIYFYDTTLSYVPPCIIVPNDDNWQDWYDYYLSEDRYDPYLIDDVKIEEWKQPYISLKDDNSNFDEYWNQPLEADAREFASWFTGIEAVVENIVY